MLWSHMYFKSKMVKLRLPYLAWISILDPASQNFVVFVLVPLWNLIRRRLKSEKKWCLEFWNTYYNGKNSFKILNL